jgi:hypothetical protein
MERRLAATPWEQELDHSLFTMTGSYFTIGLLLHFRKYSSTASSEIYRRADSSCSTLGYFPKSKSNLKANCYYNSHDGVEYLEAGFGRQHENSNYKLHLQTPVPPSRDSQMQDYLF